MITPRLKKRRKILHMACRIIPGDSAVGVDPSGYYNSKGSGIRYGAGTSKNSWCTTFTVFNGILRLLCSIVQSEPWFPLFFPSFDCLCSGRTVQSPHQNNPTMCGPAIVGHSLFCQVPAFPPLTFVEGGTAVKSVLTTTYFQTIHCVGKPSIRKWWREDTYSAVTEYFYTSPCTNTSRYYDSWDIAKFSFNFNKIPNNVKAENYRKPKSKTMPTSIL